MRKRNTKKVLKVCKIAHGKRRDLAMMGGRCTVQRWKETNMEYTLTTAAAADAICNNLWLWRASEIAAYKADPRQYIIDYCAGALCVNLKKAQQHAAEVQARVDAWLEENAERIAERAEVEA